MLGMCVVCMHACVCVHVVCVCKYVYVFVCMCCVFVGKQIKLKKLPFSTESQGSKNVSSMQDKTANVLDFVIHTVAIVIFHFCSIQGFLLNSAKNVLVNK